MADKTKRITISVEDQFSRQLKAYVDNVVRAEQATQQFSNSAKGPSGFGASVRSAAQDIFYMGNAAMMSYQTVRQLVGGLNDMAQAGFAAERAELALTKITGSAREAEQYISALDRATMGTITSAEAAAQSYQLIRFGLVDSAAEAERFVRTVSIVSASNPALGSTAEAINQIQLTLSNMSYMRLDQLGISAGQVRSRVQELKREIGGLSTEDAFRMAVFEQLDEQARTLGDDILEVGNSSAQLKTRLDELKTDVGRIIGVGFEWAADKILDTADALGWVIDKFDKLSGGYMLPGESAIYGMSPLLAQALSPAYASVMFGVGRGYASENAAVRGVPQFLSAEETHRWLNARYAEDMAALGMSGYYGGPQNELYISPRQYAAASDADLANLIGFYQRHPNHPNQALYQAEFTAMMSQWQSRQPARQSPQWYAAQGAMNMGGWDEAAATAWFNMTYPGGMPRTGRAAVDQAELERGVRDAFVKGALGAIPGVGSALGEAADQGGKRFLGALEAAAQEVKFSSLADRFGFDQSSFDADVIGTVERALSNANVEQEQMNTALEMYNHLTGAANAQSTLYNNQLDWLSQLLAEGKIDASQFVTELQKINSVDFSGLNWLTTAFQIKGPEGWDAYVQVLDTLSTMDFSQLQAMSNLPQTVQGMAETAASTVSSLMTNLVGSGGGDGKGASAGGLAGAIQQWADSAETSIAGAIEGWEGLVSGFRDNASADFDTFQQNALESLGGITQQLQDMNGMTISVVLDVQAPGSVTVPINLDTGGGTSSVGAALSTTSSGGGGAKSYSSKGLGSRAGGGGVAGLDLVEVNEPFGTRPELFTAGGRQFLLAPPGGGFVSPAAPGGGDGGGAQPVSVAVYLDGAQIAARVVRNTKASQQGNLYVARGT